MQQRVIVIAEAGVNHNGRVELALRLIDAAKQSGADYVKFQTWITENIVAPNAPKAPYQIHNDGAGTQAEMLKRLELSFSSFRQLKAYAESVGIGFISTADDVDSLDFLVDELGMEIIKVGSGEVTNHFFLKAIGMKKRPVFLSTGMSCLGEVERAQRILKDAGSGPITLLHCTSAYPASLDMANIRAMTTMAHAFDCPVGYSDHMLEDEASLAAVSLGATVIEKHLTLDRTMTGPDHAASLDPKMFAEFVRRIRNISIAMSGSGRKEPQSAETATKRIVQRGCFAAYSLPVGTKLKHDSIKLLRPCIGVAADKAELLIGARLKNAVAKGEPIRWSDVDF